MWQQKMKLSELLAGALVRDTLKKGEHCNALRSNYLGNLEISTFLKNFFNPHSLSPSHAIHKLLGARRQPTTTPHLSD